MSNHAGLTVRTSTKIEENVPGLYLTVTEATVPGCGSMMGVMLIFLDVRFVPSDGSGGWRPGSHRLSTGR